MPRVKQSRPTLKAFGDNLRSARQRAKLTQVELADKLDVSVSYVSLLERGARNPPLLRLLEVARSIGVPPARLLPVEA